MLETDMAKSRSSGAADGTKKSNDKLPKALREAGQRAAELAQNPVARSMLAAGLVTAAAALTSSQKVRSSVKQAGKDAADTAEAAGDSAAKIGAAIVTAATDAVRRLMATGNEDKATPATTTSAPKRGRPKGSGTATKAKSAAKPKTGASTRKPAARKTAGAAAAANSASPAATKSKPAARKPATRKTGARKPAAKPSVS